MDLSYTMDTDESSVWMLVPAAAQAKDALPYVQELGDFIAHARYETRRDGLPSYLIKYTLSGEGRLVYDGQESFLPAGHFFWIDCQKPQYYQTSPRTGKWRVIWLHIYGPGCAYYYERFLALNGGRCTGELPQGNPVVSDLYQLMALFRKEPLPESADLTAAALVTDVMAACVQSAERRGGTGPRYVRQAQDYIAAHYKDRLRLDELATALSLNKFYLQKMFLRETGVSPAVYTQQLRLFHAKEMLRTGDASLAVIAREVGVGSESYLIRLFRAAEGMTPAEYRRRWRA